MPGHYRRGALTRPRGAHASSLFSGRPDFSGRLSPCSLHLIIILMPLAIGQYLYVHVEPIAVGGVGLLHHLELKHESYEPAAPKEFGAGC
jgi:hypothetical protein